MKVLVVAAHPDDEVLGCGGTIARLAAEGAEVRIAILAEGITSRYQQREQADQDALRRLHADVQECARILGASGISLHGFPDNRMDTVALLDVVKVVEGLIELHRPQRIYTHHPGDLNVDHLITHRAVMTATRPCNASPVAEVFAFEVPSSTEWAFQRIEPAFCANTFVNIGGHLEKKIAAMQAYRSEVRPFPHPRSPEALTAIARRWGSVAGCEAAEAFELIRSIS